MAERLFDVERKHRRRHGHLPVPVDKTVCPDCGGPTTLLTFHEPALFVGLGYGATRTSTVRHCGWFCGHVVTESVQETSPRRAN